MRQNPVAPPLRPQEPQPLTSHKLRFSIGAQVVAIHCLVIFGPLGYVLYRNWLTPQESAFKVKLVGPLSTGEEVGPPSRLRPSPNPGPPEPPAPEPPAPEPPKPVPPSPKPPEPPPVPKPAVKKPSPKPPVVRKPTPKPPVVKKPVQKQPARQTTQRKPATQQRPRQLSAAEQVALARRNATKYGNGGGSNTNMAVPIGNADRAQTYGKQNNGTPGGGAKGEDERYWSRLGNYIKMRWSEPPGSLLGDARPQVTIQLAIAGDGRVTDARIIRRSGNRSMDESVQRMLANLDRVPAPSNGSTSIQMILRTQD